MRKIMIKKIILIICGMILISGNAAIAQNKGIKKSTETKHVKIKLGNDEIDIRKIRSSKKWHEIKKVRTKEVLNGEKVIKNTRVTVFETPNSGYIGKDKDITLEADSPYAEDFIEHNSIFTLYTIDGKKVFEKYFKRKSIASGAILKNGYCLFKFNKMDDKGRPYTIREWEIYDKNGDLIYKLDNVSQFAVSPQADYILILQKGKDDKRILKKLDLNGELKILHEFKGNKWIRGISEDGKCVVITGRKKSAKMFQEGWYYRIQEIYFFKNDRLIWTKVLQAEGFYGTYISKLGKYVIVRYEKDVLWKKRKLSDNSGTYWVHKRGVEYNKVLDTTTQKIVYDGVKNDSLIKKYKEERIDKKRDKGVK